MKISQTRNDFFSQTLRAQYEAPAPRGQNEVAQRNLIFGWCRSTAEQRKLESSHARANDDVTVATLRLVKDVHINGFRSQRLLRLDRLNELLLERRIQ